MNEWIEVNNGKMDVVPDKDCEIWIARCGMGEGWLQKIVYCTKQNGYIGWDGTVAYQIAVPGVKPKPYIKHYANKEIFCKKIY
ncbi:hypothetical protein [Roseburia sp. 831b]|uniref:hypothetical protein n=1 Tax=Roseburia sp. 831b TaxID=1261635 RepID=UPI0009515A8D|nr:hypothetical protein [Roseburia sp. 831b]WVK73788.1 hypothetical protein BIV16_04540 [Roseburia sp. 831b]